MRNLILLLTLVFGQDPSEGELLPNGIRLPADWPPKPKAAPTSLPTPPYLQSPGCARRRVPAGTPRREQGAGDIGGDEGQPDEAAGRMAGSPSWIPKR